MPGYQGSLGTTTIASHVTPIQAFGMEFILSFVITLTFMADPRNSLPTTAALLGATLVSVSFFFFTRVKPKSGRTRNNAKQGDDDDTFQNKSQNKNTTQI